MGEYRDSRNIRHFQPDNTENILYIPSNLSVSFFELQVLIADHFGTDNIDDFTVEAEHIHTSCLGYDRYEYSDHTNFLVITRK